MNKFILIFSVFLMLAGCSPAGELRQVPPPTLEFTQPVIPETLTPSPDLLTEQPSTPTTTPTEDITSTTPPEVSDTPSPTTTSTLTAMPVLSLSPSPSETPVARLTGSHLNLIIQTCDTEIDIFNRMGEVTNAYVTLQNIGDAELSNLTITLNASDEERPHPDKQVSIQVLPSGYEISFKLTVDTQDQVETSIQSIATSSNGVSASAGKTSCRSRHPDQVILDTLGELGAVKKIQ